MKANESFSEINFQIPPVSFHENSHLVTEFELSLSSGMHFGDAVQVSKFLEDLAGSLCSIGVHECFIGHPDTETVWYLMDDERVEAPVSEAMYAAILSLLGDREDSYDLDLELPITGTSQAVSLERTSNGLHTVVHFVIH